MTGKRAILHGGPRDGATVDLGPDLPWRTVFPRYRDDMTLVFDAYEFAGAKFHYDGTPHPFRYAGEEEPPDPSIEPEDCAGWVRAFLGWLSRHR